MSTEQQLNKNDFTLVTFAQCNEWCYIGSDYMTFKVIQFFMRQTNGKKKNRISSKWLSREMGKHSLIDFHGLSSLCWLFLSICHWLSPTLTCWDLEDNLNYWFNLDNLSDGYWLKKCRSIICRGQSVRANLFLSVKSNITSIEITTKLTYLSRVQWN